MASDPILLYDGECGFCAANVQFILRHDPGGRLRFAPLQGAFATAVRARHPELQGVDSMVWVDPASGGDSERVFARSAAALRAARYLGGFWRLALAAALIPRTIRDAAYDFIARHRHQLAGGETCLVPAPDVRARFLE